MSVVIALVVIALVIALVGLVVMAVRSGGEQSGGRDEPKVLEAPTRPMPHVEDFHVRGDTATVVFAVPLGDEAPGAHLTDLLDAAAVEHVREKVHQGLPLDGVKHISVYGLRDSERVHLNTVDLPEEGELPEPMSVGRDSTSHDPIAAVQAVVADSSVAAPSQRGDTLEPVTGFIELSGPTEAHLRTMGVDTSSMSLEDLVLGLFRVSGYQVDGGRSGFSMQSVPADDVHWVSRDGRSAVLVIIRHEPGSYPELDEKVLAEFSVAASQANLSQAILVTDKFSPYAMYERERRDKRLVFVTRERLQSFVDSFGLS